MSENTSIPKYTRNCRQCCQVGHLEIPVKGHQCPYNLKNSASESTSQSTAPLQTLFNSPAVHPIQVPPPQSPIQSDHIRTIHIPSGPEYLPNEPMNMLQMSQSYPSASIPILSHPQTHIPPPGASHSPQGIHIDPSLFYIDTTGSTGIQDASTPTPNAAGPSPTPFSLVAAPHLSGESGGVILVSETERQWDEDGDKSQSVKNMAKVQDEGNGVVTGLVSSSPNNLASFSELPGGEPVPQTRVSQPNGPISGLHASLPSVLPTNAPSPSSPLPIDCSRGNGWPQACHRTTGELRGATQEELQVIKHQCHSEDNALQGTYSLFYLSNLTETLYRPLSFQTPPGLMFSCLWLSEFPNSSPEHISHINTSPETLGHGNMKFFVSPNLCIDGDTTEELESKLSEVCTLFLQVRDAIQSGSWQCIAEHWERVSQAEMEREMEREEREKAEGTG
ncbi:hypothetical protein M422DRAFT_48786 [Sphaerobolus stellatus SS14]|uniref:Uncharacterized protein n=1 Tax=Sphaerobolus stellatus (strain SS14) TaxID=990650 RepID=A0A0C9VSG6_SPHS4|nr:hypothetical protein M422DRAFT_48786 [Sphaerobolus stellatus SS14]